MAAPDIPAAKRAGLAVDLDRLAEEGDGWLTPEDRYALKTWGVCTQLQDHVFMVRIRVPGGVLPTDQARTVARLAARHGSDWVHLTTRQNLELHWVADRAVRDLLADLERAGLSTRSACGHTLRNVMCSEDAGVALDEPFDCLPDAVAVSDAIVARSAELNCTLPSRINIAFGGSPRCREDALINDAAFVSVVVDAVPGYRVYAGGSLGKAPALAIELAAFIPRTDAVPAAVALAETFIAHGDFEKPVKGRLKFCIEGMGADAFRKAWREAFAEARARADGPAPVEIPVLGPGDRAAAIRRRPEGGWSAGVRPQREPGRASLTVALPLGDTNRSELELLADLADRYGDGHLILGRDQDVILRNVPVEHVGAIRVALTPRGLSFLGEARDAQIRACTGSAVCALGISPAPTPVAPCWPRRACAGTAPSASTSRGAPTAAPSTRRATSAWPAPRCAWAGRPASATTCSWGPTWAPLSPRPGPPRSWAAWQPRTPPPWSTPSWAPGRPPVTRARPSRAPSPASAWMPSPPPSRPSSTTAGPRDSSPAPTVPLRPPPPPRRSPPDRPPPFAPLPFWRGGIAWTRSHRARTVDAHLTDPSPPPLVKESPVPVPIPSALDDAGAAAAAKATAVRSLPRYLASAGLAGAFVGIAVVLLVSVSAPLVLAGSPAAKLVQGAVFGVALTLVVFAGSELFTGNAMVMLQGLREKTVTGGELAAMWAASLFGNLAGSLALAAVVHGGGTLTGDGETVIAKIVATKDAAAGPQLFWRSVLCNLLVCLGLWMAGRVQSDAAKAIVLWPRPARGRGRARCRGGGPSGRRGRRPRRPRGGAAARPARPPAGRRRRRR